MDTGRRTALGSAFFANFSQFGARVVISPFVPAIALTYGASKATIGVVLTLLWAVFAIAHYPSGVLADRFGPGRVIRVALVLVTLGSAMIAVAPTLGAFALGCLVLGIGGGSYFPTGQTFLSGLFDSSGRGQALSIHAAGGPVAGVVFPAVAAGVAFRHDWRAGIAVGTFAALVTSAVIWWVLRDSAGGDSSVEIRDRLHPGNVSDLLGRRPVLITLAIGGSSMYLVQAFVSFYPTFLQEYHAIGKGTASVYFGGAFLVVAVGLPAIGRLADRIPVERVLLVPYAAMTVGVALLLSVTAVWSLIAGSVLIGVGLSAGGAIAKRAMSHFVDSTRGTGFGILRMLFVLIGSLANVITGTLAQFHGWLAAYGVLVGLSVAGVLGLTALAIGQSTRDGW